MTESQRRTPRIVRWPLLLVVADGLIVWRVRNPSHIDHHNASCRSEKTLMPISKNAVIPIRFRPPAQSVIGRVFLVRLT
jgi:hypothetical protein